MYTILGIIGFVIFTPKIMKQVIAEKKAYEECQQWKGLPLFLILFPVGPVVLWILPNIVGWIPAAAVAAACYLPALLLSRRHITAFERSGSSRTDAALESAHMAFGGALVGLVYVGILVTLYLTMGGI